MRNWDKTELIQTIYFAQFKKKRLKENFVKLTFICESPDSYHLPIYLEMKSNRSISK